MGSRWTWILFAGLVLAITAPGSAADKPTSPAATPAAPPTPEVKMENLMERMLPEDFLPGGQVIMSVVEVPPNTTLERHWHPGEEFQYLLEGEAELLVDGQPTVRLVPGTAAHVPYKALHTARTLDKSAKVLVVRVHRAGEPIRYLEKGGSAKK